MKNIKKLLFNTEKSSKEVDVVIALDFDGTIFDEIATNAPPGSHELTEDYIIESNEKFFDFINDIVLKDNKIKKMVLVSGSSRFSVISDHTSGTGNFGEKPNPRHSGSGPLQLPKIADQIEKNSKNKFKPKVDTFLLFDLGKDGEENKGKTFSDLKEMTEEDPYGRFQFRELNEDQKRQLADDSTKNVFLTDNDKTILIYTLLQRAAEKAEQKEKGTKNIDFYFFDDAESILVNLQTFFTQHPSLIPKNIHLHLVLYSNSNKANVKIEEKACIQGGGNPNTEYRKTVTSIMRQGCFFDLSTRKEDLEFYVNYVKMKAFKNLFPLFLEQDIKMLFQAVTQIDIAAASEKVSLEFASKVMQGILKEFYCVKDTSDYAEFKWSVISALLGKLEWDDQENKWIAYGSSQFADYINKKSEESKSASEKQLKKSESESERKQKQPEQKSKKKKKLKIPKEESENEEKENEEKEKQLKESENEQKQPEQKSKKKKKLKIPKKEEESENEEKESEKKEKQLKESENEQKQPEQKLKKKKKLKTSKEKEESENEEKESEKKEKQSNQELLDFLPTTLKSDFGPRGFFCGPNGLPEKEKENEEWENNNLPGVKG